MPPVAPPQYSDALSWHVSIDPAETGTTAALLIAEFQDAWWIVDEFMYNGAEGMRTHKELAIEIRRWVSGYGVPIQTVTTDHSPNMMIELSNVFTCPIIPAIKDDVFGGIELTQYALSQGIIRLSQNVTGLLTEMAMYSWDEKASVLGEDVPIKMKDHACDAMRYFAATIANTRRGDLSVEYAWQDAA